ncbi:hypothetical protein C8T65DRAFT_644276 [Cerioporus squamosus]|nr:hypothetical protein C8T65DRAFT_644276 [Cerioporus squamosus]
MLPTNYGVGQPGLPQPQQQAGPQPGMPNMAGVDQARLWQIQQAQQHQQHQQQQLAALRAAQGNTVTEQQMMEFLRSRGGMPNQPQGMPQQQPQRQLPFGGMPQLGANGMPSFSHDPSQGLPNAQAQFGNTPGGQNFSNNLQLQQALARTQNQMFSNQGNDSMRQLNLMLQQQNQNGMPNQNAMAAFQRLQQSQQQHPQQQQTQHPQHSQGMGGAQLPPGIFAGAMNPSMSGNMPSNLQASQLAQARQAGMIPQLPQHGGMSDGQMQAQGQPNQQRRPLNLQDMHDKAQQLRNSIAATEGRIKQYQMQQQVGGGPIPPDHLASEINRMQKDVEQRREALRRILAIVQGVAGGGTPGGLTLPLGMKPPSASPIPTQRIPGGPTNPSQVGWMQQPGPSASPAHQYTNSPRPMPNGPNMMQNGHPQQGVRPMSTPQLPPQMVASQSNQPIPRTAATPLQGPNAGGAMQSTPQQTPNPAQAMLGSGGMGVPNGQPGQHPTLAGMVLTPLMQPQFKRAYWEQWYPKHQPKDQSALRFEDRPIDLHQLHVEVMNAGSYRIVNQKDLWPVIGAKLGFVHFPGNENEPGRAGPALAAHLEHIYKEFLLEFDQQYLRQLFQHRRQLAAAQYQNQKNAATGHGSMDGGMSMQAGPQLLTDVKDPKVVNELISYALVSAQEMQQRGVAPQLIQLVERHRDTLKNMQEQQRNFQQKIQTAAQQGGAQGQPRNLSNQLMNGQQMNGMNPMGNAQQPGMNLPNGIRPNMPSGPQPGMSTPAMQQNGQQQQQQMGANGPQGHMPGVRPTPQQLQSAIEMVRRLREENKNVMPPTNRMIQIPDAQRIEYNALFENLHRMISEVDGKLPHYAVFMKEEVIRKLVLMINAVQQQRELLSGQGPPRYIMPLELVRSMTSQVHAAERMFKGMLSSMFPGQNGAPRPQMGAPGQPGAGAPTPAQQHGQMPTVQQRHLPHPPHPPTVQSIPSLPAQAASSPAVPPAHTPSAASPPLVTGTPILKKPTPKPTAETPSAATPTHTVNSPQTPKSPRTKPKPKPVPKPRKASTKVTSAAANAASPSAGPSEPKPPATPATPANAPTPDSVGSKRAREEDATALSTAAAAPAAKKIKTEWDEPPSDAMSKRQQEADAVKTDDDAVKFFEQMSSWLNQVTNNEGEAGESLKTEIADSLDEILKAYPSIPDDGGLSSLASSSFIDAITVGSSSPRQNASTVDPADFFDFTSYGLPEEETGSKAATPDLLPASSSVGPSPGSASETEAHPPASTAADTAKIVDPKAEPGEGVDSIPQELWRAIDGGESAFYNASDNWKWDQPMPAVDQPWAFFPSS